MLFRSPIHGRSPYLPGPVRLRLDSIPVRPEADPTLLRIQFDTTAGARVPRTDHPLLAHWSPYRTGDHIYVFWGDGFTGLDMRLRVRADRLDGPSVNTTDFGILRGRRIACDGL